MNPASLQPQITALQAQLVTLQNAFAQTQKELENTRLENKLLCQKLDALACRYFGKQSAQLSSAQLEFLVSGLARQRLLPSPAYDSALAHKRIKEIETKVGTPFEKEEHYQRLCRRQSEIEEQLDLTKNQAPSQVETESNETVEHKTSEGHTHMNRRPRAAQRAAVCI